MFGFVCTEKCELAVQNTDMYFAKWNYQSLTICRFFIWDHYCSQVNLQRVFTNTKPVLSSAVIRIRGPEKKKNLTVIIERAI